MKILVANDDGINAKGIKSLVLALKDMAEIYVFAPNRQRSGKSHSLTIDRSVKMEKVDFSGAKLAFSIDGTPTDCVRMGLRVLNAMDIKIDMVCSGINHGGNMGTDSLYSGTMAAAYEGALEGIPALAFSVDGSNAEHFEYSMDVAKKTVPMVKELGFKGSVVSINTPNLPASEIKGLKVGEMNFIEYPYKDDIRFLDNGNVEFTYSSEIKPNPGALADDDVELVKKGYATISIVKHLLTHKEGMELLRKEMGKYDF